MDNTKEIDLRLKLLNDKCEREGLTSYDVIEDIYNILGIPIATEPCYSEWKQQITEQKELYIHPPVDSVV